MSEETTTEREPDSRKSTLSRRKFLIGSGTVGGALVSGAGYQGIGTAQDRRRYPPPGELVTVGTHRLHLTRLGSERRGPTVVLEAGAGDFSLGWHGFQERVAEFAPVVSTDRAGLGWSDSTSEPRSAGRAADELYTALQTANVSEPYVLVGHSYGGPVVRLFAHRYPEAVAGLVFVDTPDESILEELLPGQARIYRVLNVASHVGVLRLAGALGVVPPATLAGPHIDEYPDDVRKAYERIVTAPKHLKAAYTESSMAAETVEELREATDLGGTPLTIIHANHDMHGWQAVQRRHTELSTNSERLVADTQEHFVHHAQPEPVLDAIASMVGT